jgi:hypothetical protein
MTLKMAVSAPMPRIKQSLPEIGQEHADLSTFQY